jgi:hypothetical protein
MNGAMLSPVPSPLPPPEPAAGRWAGLTAVLPRRQALGVLVSGVLGLLAGCRRASPGAAPTPSAGAAEPDLLVPDLADEQRLLTVYDSVLHDHPELAGRLRPLRSNHAAHVAALRQAMGLPPGTGTAGPTGSAPPGATGGPPPTALPPNPSAPARQPPTGSTDASTGLPPASPAAALATLRSLEHAAVLARAAAAVRASGGRAALLASLAACSASHEVMLT